MSDAERERKPGEPAEPVDPRLRRAVSRRTLLTDELGRAGVDFARQLPGLAPLLGFALRETPAQRDRRLVHQLWKLLVGRVPKPEEAAASLQCMTTAGTPDEKADALVDILWALCHSQEFEARRRPDADFVVGFYRLALKREPTAEQLRAALEVLNEAAEPDAKAAALEGMFNGLIHSWDSVLRK